MTGGEKLLIAGAAGLGIVAFLKFRQTNNQDSPPVGPSKITSQWDTSAITGPFAPVAKVLQPVVTKSIDKLNSSFGGANPYAGLTKNADGSYTDGTGAKITFNSDGTITRKNPSWKATNGGKVIYGTYTTVKNIGKDIASIF